MNQWLIPLQIEQLPEGFYLATSDAFPGLLAQGCTIEETVDIARDVARELIKSHQEHGDPVPSTIRPVPQRFEMMATVGC